jgi:hypothetical protein
MARTGFLADTPCRIWAIWVNCAGMDRPAAPRNLICVFVAAVLAWLPAAVVLPQNPAAVGDVGARFSAAARRAGLRLLEGRHLLLATDRPVRAGDGVEELPAVFDQAFAVWCRHFGIEPAAQSDWRAVGCLMVDRERFRLAGLLPDDGKIPDFKNGFCEAGRFWLMDQSNPTYRRHLLLHEGVHAFTLTLRSSTAPSWYTEGIAEYLATHRVEPLDEGPPRFIQTPIPAAAPDVEQLGRIEMIRRGRATARAPSLGDVFLTPPSAHQSLDAYAASWAAVALLAGHPAHAAALAAAEQSPLDDQFTARLRRTAGWDDTRAGRDFDAFTDELDYGFDFSRSSIDWSQGSPLVAPARIDVDATLGWQNSGFSLEKGGRHRLVASGRVTVGAIADTTLESEPGGISLRWYRGRPVGRLLAAQWVEQPDDGGRPRFVVVGEGSRSEFTALADGSLYLKINDAPGDLADNAGSLSVQVE